jgi:hypothetical protein
MIRPDLQRCGTGQPSAYQRNSITIAGQRTANPVHTLVITEIIGNGKIDPFQLAAILMIDFAFL